MPIDYKKRDPDWKAVRARILARANNCCEECGIANGLVGWRFPSGNFYTVDEYGGVYMEDEDEEAAERILQKPPFRIILTIAHLNHNEHEWPVPDDTLKALCQYHHLKLDAPEKARRRREKAAKTPLPLFA